MDIMALILAKKAAAALVAENGEVDKQQQEAIDRFMKEHTQYEATMSGLREDVNKNAENIGINGDNLNAHKSDAEAHKPLFDAQKAALDAHVADYNAHIKAFEDQIKARDAEIDALEATDVEIKANAVALEKRVHDVEKDYLKAEDKEALIANIATAKQEAILAILGEGVNTDFDTLQEVANWIQSDTTNSAALIARVTTIENDYLKAEDKSELARNIKAIADDYLTSKDKEAFEATHTEINSLLSKHTKNLSDIEGNIDIVEGRIETIEKDYLKAADKEGLSKRIDTIASDYLKASDRQTLEASIKVITDDYLKAADKNALIATADADRAYFNGEIARIDRDYMTNAEKQLLWDHVNTVTYHLPVITEADKDKFLKAVDGKWAFVEMKFQKIYVGNTTPAADLGTDGDLYIQTE